MADLETAKRLGFKYRKFVATLDKRTSKICHKHDGELIKIEDSKIGVNTPPMHPYYRSIMVDIDPDWYEDFKGEIEKVEEKGKLDYMAKHKLFEPTKGDMQANKLFVINNKDSMYRISSKSTDTKEFVWYKSKTKKTRGTIELIE